MNSESRWLRAYAQLSSRPLVWNRHTHPVPTLSNSLLSEWKTNLLHGGNKTENVINKAKEKTTVFCIFLVSFPILWSTFFVTMTPTVPNKRITNIKRPWISLLIGYSRIPAARNLIPGWPPRLIVSGLSNSSNRLGFIPHFRWIWTSCLSGPNSPSQ